MNNKYNFQQAKFYITSDSIEQLPAVTGAEIAIVGRSNSGKSSLINTLTNQKKLAFTSKTPGRTQHINFFAINDNNFLVDLPGYGYAKLPKSKQQHLSALIGDYLSDRQSLVGLIIIIDIRRLLPPAVSFTDLDHHMINEFLYQQKPIHLILSKSDKLSTSKIKQATNLVLKLLQRDYAVDSQDLPITFQTFSSFNRQGLNQLELLMSTWLNQKLNSI